ncbi:uncharacterized protein LOC142585802 [Dermacentor variabilis]|uniref:uncharacterized protein LOC142585802 n=1 Tax=Dermacentor variabilis TaxID=34621 RepID=UPI003F5BEF5D
MHSCFQPRSTSVPSVLLHDSTGCAPKDYFGHEHHLFRKQLLLLQHSLASSVLLADWTCLLALHYYWFCTPVFNCGPQAYPACPSTTLRSALQKITSGTSITRSMSNCYSLYILSRTASCWWTGLASSPCTTTGFALLFSTAVHKRTQRALTRLYGLRSKRLLRPRASRVPGATTTASTFPRQWRPAGRLDLPPRPALLLVLHSCFRLRWVPSTLLHIDSQFCAPEEITSGTSITRSMSDCYCFYVLSPTASCWQTGLSLAPLHLIVVPSFCCRLWRKRNIPARSFTRIFLALPHEQPSSARSSCRVLYTTSFLMNS